MPIAWFFCPYKRSTSYGGRPARYCAMDDFTAQIRVDGGDWAESEVLGNQAIVKVNASAGTLTTIAAASGFTRLSKNALNLSLSDLTTPQKTALKNFVLDLGYSNEEIQTALGNDLGAHTLGDVLRFCASRKRATRYDQATDSIVLDGAAQDCRSIDDVDRAVS